MPFETCHAYIAAKPWTQTGGNLHGILEELNVACEVIRPDKIAGAGMSEARSGDRWECVIEEINVFRRTILLKPLRLASRWE